MRIEQSGEVNLLLQTQVEFTQSPFPEQSLGQSFCARKAGSSKLSCSRGRVEFPNVELLPTVELTCTGICMLFTVCFSITTNLQSAAKESTAVALHAFSSSVS